MLCNHVHIIVIQYNEYAFLNEIFYHVWTKMVMADQVPLWSDKVQATVIKLFSSLYQGNHIGALVVTIYLT